MKDSSVINKKNTVDFIGNQNVNASASSNDRPLKLLFLTLGCITNINNSGIYNDFIRTLIKYGHTVHVVQPYERKAQKENRPFIVKDAKLLLLNVKTLNITECTMFEKGIAMLLLERQFILAIKNHLKNEDYDLVIYSTPPVTFSSVVRFVKKLFGCKSYLLLKDIFPQNAVDLGILHKGTPIYRYFRKKEITLYKCSDLIGCMSFANKEYLLKNNPWLNKDLVKLFPNAIEIKPLRKVDNGIIHRKYTRESIGVKDNACVFIMGGNFGKPQDVDFLLSIISKNFNKEDRHFIICGSGADFSKILQYSAISKQRNLTTINRLPKDEFSNLLFISDVGMIVLSHMFTIPNIPSRLLDYLQHELPVVAFTDDVTDLKDIIKDYKIGWWENSSSIERCCQVIDEICKLSSYHKIQFGINGKTLLKEKFDIDVVYRDFISDVNAILY